MNLQYKYSKYKHKYMLYKKGGAICQTDKHIDINVVKTITGSFIGTASKLYPDTLNVTMHNNTSQIFDNPTLLGKGTYGIVLSYLFQGDILIVVKLMSTKNSLGIQKEKEIADKINSNSSLKSLFVEGIFLDQVSSLVTEYNTNKEIDKTYAVVIMNKFTHDLSFLLKKHRDDITVPPDVKMQLDYIKRLGIMMGELHKNNTCYVDCNLGNLMYCEQTKSIYFCDYQGLCSLPDILIHPITTRITHHMIEMMDGIDKKVKMELATQIPPVDSSNLYAIKKQKEHEAYRTINPVQQLQLHKTFFCMFIGLILGINLCRIVSNTAYDKIREKFLLLYTADPDDIKKFNGIFDFTDPKTYAEINECLSKFALIRR